jgi:hypothetical protein
VVVWSEYAGILVTLDAGNDEKRLT